MSSWSKNYCSAETGLSKQTSQKNEVCNTVITEGSKSNRKRWVLQTETGAKTYGGCRETLNILEDVREYSKEAGPCIQECQNVHGDLRVLGYLLLFYFLERKQRAQVSGERIICSQSAERPSVFSDELNKEFLGTHSSVLEWSLTCPSWGHGFSTPSGTECLVHQIHEFCKDFKAKCYSY